MIISHEHKFIFVKTRKRAGTSIEIALSKFCGPDDVICPITESDELVREQVGHRGAQNYHLPLSRHRPGDWLQLLKTRKRKVFYNHMSAGEIRRAIGEKSGTATGSSA